MKTNSAFIINRVYQTIQREGLADKGETILIGLSGGPDSVALTLLLKAINERYQRKWRLVTAHLNHGIRGAEALRDERFVRQFSRQAGLPFYNKRVKLRSDSGLEARARTARYRFLAQLARRLRAGKVAVGHTQDDQAETVLMRLLRGAGLRGLRSILPARPILPGARIILIRPLLGITRPEVLQFLKEQAQPYCTDSTNINHDLLRNKVRCQLLPYLAEYNPGIKGHLVRLGRTAQEVYDYLDVQAAKFIPRRHTLAVARLAQMPTALRAIVLAEMIKKVTGRLPDLSAAHYQSITQLLGRAQSGKKVHLPNRLVVRRTPKGLLFTRETRRS